MYNTRQIWEGKQYTQKQITTNNQSAGACPLRKRKLSTTQMVDQKQPNYAKRTQFPKDQNERNFC